MRKALLVIGLVFFGAACADTSSAPVVEIGEASTLERMSKDECDARMDMYLDAMKDLNAVVEGGVDPSNRGLLKETITKSIDVGRFLIQECGYLDPVSAASFGDTLDELEDVAAGL